jgi:hypothetical protein
MIATHEGRATLQNVTCEAEPGEGQGHGGQEDAPYLSFDFSLAVDSRVVADRA